LSADHQPKRQVIVKDDNQEIPVPSRKDQRNVKGPSGTAEDPINLDPDPWSGASRKRAIALSNPVDGRGRESGKEKSTAEPANVEDQVTIGTDSDDDLFFRN
jgi:hypothetical protein